MPLLYFFICAGSIAEIALDALRDLSSLVLKNALLDGIGAALAKAIQSAAEARAAQHNCRRLLGAMSVAVRSFDASSGDHCLALRACLDRCVRLLGSYASGRSWWANVMANGSSRRQFESLDKDLRPFCAHNAANIPTEFGVYVWGPEETLQGFVERRVLQLTDSPDADVPTLIKALAIAYRGAKTDLLS